MSPWFCGTVLPKDLFTKFGQKTGVTLFQQIAAFMRPFSDLMSDMHVALGTQAEAPLLAGCCFESTNAWFNFLLVRVSLAYICGSGPRPGTTIFYAIDNRFYASVELLV
jgi:hypothetical protein